MPRDPRANETWGFLGTPHRGASAGLLEPGTGTYCSHPSVEPHLVLFLVCNAVHKFPLVTWSFSFKGQLRSSLGTPVISRKTRVWLMKGAHHSSEVFHLSINSCRILDLCEFTWGLPSAGLTGVVHAGTQSRWAFRIWEWMTWSLVWQRCTQGFKAV